MPIGELPGLALLLVAPGAEQDRQSKLTAVTTSVMLRSGTATAFRISP
jgi:hypothetical protein